MTDKPSTQEKQEQTAASQDKQPLSWEAIGKLSKEEYLARRDEIQVWMKRNISSSGRVIK